ncbi:unnamed protein product [Allacma fusca]|uniref:Uncharacterized protein n=1 Tax=Allacma fusca TaxID=39272 RepID=A0A8J2J077_9HEXA|nr:unnamed protein product [Allacma fusca]
MPPKDDPKKRQDKVKDSKENPPRKKSRKHANSVGSEEYKPLQYSTTHVDEDQTQEPGQTIPSDKKRSNPPEKPRTSKDKPAGELPTGKLEIRPPDQPTGAKETPGSQLPNEQNKDTPGVNLVARGEEKHDKSAKKHHAKSVKKRSNPQEKPATPKDKPAGQLPTDKLEISPPVEPTGAKETPASQLPNEQNKETPGVNLVSRGEEKRDKSAKKHHAKSVKKRSNPQEKPTTSNDKPAGQLPIDNLEISPPDEPTAAKETPASQLPNERNKDKPGVNPVARGVSKYVKSAKTYRERRAKSAKVYRDKYDMPTVMHRSKSVKKRSNPPEKPRTSKDKPAGQLPTDKLETDSPDEPTAAKETPASQLPNEQNREKLRVNFDAREGKFGKSARTYREKRDKSEKKYGEKYDKSSRKYREKRDKSAKKYRDKHAEHLKKKQEKYKEREKNRPPVQKSKARIRHVNDFQRPHWRRPHLLEDLLHFMKRFDRPTDTSNGLMMLTNYGIPGLGRLFDLLFYADPVPFDFEDYVKLVCSAVVHSWGPLNTGNRYLPVSKFIPSIQAVRYKGVKMHPDEFVEVEVVKAVKRRKALEEVAPQAENTVHVEFLKNLTIQQNSSLPLTVMHDILYTQIEIVATICEKYKKILGSSNPNSKLAVAHYNLMQKHLQIFHFMGLRTMPPLCIVRKYEEEPKEENSEVTSSSSSEFLDELEDFFEEVGKPTWEETKVRQQEKDEEILLRTGFEKSTETAAALTPAEPIV